MTGSKYLLGGDPNGVSCQRARRASPGRLGLPGGFRRCLEHALRSQRGQALGYAPREGVPRLRELVAQDLARQGIPASAEDILITTGSQQALDQRLRMTGLTHRGSDRPRWELQRPEA